MAEAKVEIINDFMTVMLSTDRAVLVLLGKNSAPTGTLLTAQGQYDSFAFGKPVSTPAHGCGLQLFAADGSLLFDTENYGKAAKPVDVLFDALAAGQNTKTKTVTYPAGRTYAVMFVQNPSAFEIRSEYLNIGGSNSYYYFMDDLEVVSSVSGPTVSITLNRYLDTNPKGGPSSVPFDGSGNRASYRAIILDVTHF